VAQIARPVLDPWFGGSDFSGRLLICAKQDVWNENSVKSIRSFYNLSTS
jgi:hypothetical protein